MILLEIILEPLRRPNQLSYVSARNRSTLGRSMKKYLWRLILVMMFGVSTFSTVVQGAAIQPTLSVRRINATSIEFFWPSTASIFTLHVTESLSPVNLWTPVAVAPVDRGNEKLVVLQNLGGTRFYRLQSSPPPDARDDVASTSTGTPVTIAILANDINSSGGNLTVVDSTRPSNGTVTVSASTAAYTPNPGFSGTDTFTYTVRNTFGATDTARVTISVGAFQQPPVLSGFSPSSGVIGTEILLQGAGFVPDSAKTTIKFGPTPASALAITATSIRTIVPPGTTSGRISVTTPGGMAQSFQEFTVTTARDFSIRTEPAESSIIQGSSTTFLVSSTGQGGAADLITLAVNGLPQGVTATFSPPTLPANQQTMLTLHAAVGTPLGTSTFSVVGSTLIDGVQMSHSFGAALSIVAGGRTELRGRIKLLDGPPIQGVRFSIQRQTIQSDAAGNFQFLDLTPGTHTLSVDAIPANSKYPIYGLDVNLVAGGTLQLEPFQICPPPPQARFAQLQNATQDQTISDPRFPGASIMVPAGVTIVGWDGAPKTQIAIERLTPDRLPVPPPPFPTRTLYQPMFGTPMGGLPSKPLPVTTPNDLNLRPGQKAEIWYYEAAPIVGVQARWVKAGLGTVSTDGQTVVSDPGVGIARFCGVCGVWCLKPIQDAQPNAHPETPKPGDPVDISLGQVVVDKTDMILPGRLPAVIHRKYNPFEPFGGTAGFELGFGPGWSLTAEVVLQEESTLIRRLVLPGNARYAFIHETNGTFVNTSSPRFMGAVLTPTDGSSHVLRFRDGTTWTFLTSSRLRGIGVLVEQTDRNGNRLTFEREFDNLSQLGRIKRIIEPSGRALTFNLANNGRITAISDPIGRTVRYAYNTAGRLETVTDPAGGTTRYTYDASGRIVDITDARGITYIKSEYSADGRVFRQTQADGGIWLYSYVGAPGIATEAVVTDPRGSKTTYRFSPVGTVTELTDPLGAKTRFERNATDQITSATDTLGRVTRFEYDAAGNVARITDPTGNVRQFEYEPVFNRLIRLTDPLGNSTTFEYDSRGNLIATVDPLQNLKPIGGRLKSRINYNEFGQPVATVDVLGNRSTFSYDFFGNLEKVTDPLGNSAHRAYDLVSRLIAQTDARGRTTQFTYDQLNRLIQTVDAMGGVTKFAYDPNGNLLSLRDPLNHATTYEYDSMDRVSVRIDPLGARETFGYDPLGNLLQTLDRKGQLSSFRYDPVGRSLGATYADAATSFVYDAAGRLIQATDSAGGTILLGYDVLDRLVQETTALGTIEYSYDALNRRTSMRVPGQDLIRYSYDTKSQLERIVQGTRTVDFDHDPLGRRTRLTLPNGVSTDYSYDSASRLKELIYRNPAGILGNLTYQYHAASGRTHVGGSFARIALPDPVASATYDAANRQLIFGENTMGFDPNGNLSVLHSPSGTSSFTWDASDRLLALATPDVSAAFTYDSFGRRVSKQVNAQLTRYAYDGLDIASEVVAGVTGLLFSGSVDEPLVRGESECFLADALGSIIALTDQLGMAHTQYTYEPFGKTTIAGNSENSSQFTGRENDLTGFNFHRARYYSPTLHRFLSEDPLKFAGGDVNFYSYVSNDPINWTDPFGTDKRPKSFLERQREISNKRCRPTLGAFREKYAMAYHRNSWFTKQYTPTVLGFESEIWGDGFGTGTECAYRNGTYVPNVATWNIVSPVGFFGTAGHLSTDWILKSISNDISDSSSP